jgi:hypothetical protein
MEWLTVTHTVFMMVFILEVLSLSGHFDFYRLAKRSANPGCNIQMADLLRQMITRGQLPGGGNDAMAAIEIYLGRRSLGFRFGAD